MWLVLLGVLLTLLLLALAVFWYGPRLLLPHPKPLPDGSRADVIVVLGCRARADGTPGTVLQSRLDHAIALWRSGVSPRLLMTGAAVYTRHVEADVMARYAIAQGVPPEAVIAEREATNTLENAIRSAALMHQNGWTTAVVVSTDCHIFRASQMFAGRGLTYYVSGARPVGATVKVRTLMILWERYLLWRVVRRRWEARRGISS